MRGRSVCTAAAAVAVLGLLAPVAGAHRSDGYGSKKGQLTAQASFLTQVDRADVTFQPIITVGETLKSGFRFEAVPDGIAMRKDKKGRVTVWVNHETSIGPFPYVPAAPTAANGENDFDSSQVSELTLNRKTGGVIAGRFAITSAEGFQRFCSNFLATRKEGFDRDILFTNEESPEWIARVAPDFTAAIGNPANRQSGVTVAYDVKRKKTHVIWGMGRFNHENTVAIPGFRKKVVTLSGDDTFLSNPAQSQVYSYIARSAKKLLQDKGDLWAFVGDDPAINDYYDFLPGSTQSVSGHFIKVPKDVATGRKADGSDVVAADFGYPAPTAAEFATDALGNPADGPQWVLEHWGDLNNVFQFVRIEDIAYDKRHGMSNVVYLVDSGRGRAGAAPAAGLSTNGRIWKMVLDKDDPTIVTSLSIFHEGDDNPVKTPGEIHQPDNIETTKNSLLITEDPGSAQQFPAGSTLPNATSARVWRIPLDGSPAEVVAKVDHYADGGPTDVDGRAPGNWGAWEASGIVDASKAFGPGAFLIDVQAHTLWVEKGPGADRNGDGQPDYTNKREGGQLILMRIPGA